MSKHRIDLTHMGSRSWSANYAWHTESVWRFGNRVLRVNIVVGDDPDNRCEEAWLFDGDRWNLVAHWPLTPAVDRWVFHFDKKLSPEGEAAIREAQDELLWHVCDILAVHGAEARS
jgi:hypothetical protein